MDQCKHIVAEIPVLDTVAFVHFDLEQYEYGVIRCQYCGHLFLSLGKKTPNELVRYQRERNNQPDYTPMVMKQTSLS